MRNSGQLVDWCLIYRLVWENLKHRPVRTLLSAIFIGISVTLILTIVGLSKGVLDDVKERARGTGADIVIRPPSSTVLSFSGNMKGGEKITERVRQLPHVAIATGVLIEQPQIGQSIQGIDLDEFNAMSGGFTYREGGPFQGPDDMMVDENYAESKHLHAGSTWIWETARDGTSARWWCQVSCRSCSRSERRFRNCIRPGATCR